MRLFLIFSIEQHTFKKDIEILTQDPPSRAFEIFLGKERKVNSVRKNFVCFDLPV